jgi:hypothetical protein
MLCAIYGIPDSIMDIMEFGGADKSQQTIEYSYDHFGYALLNSGSSYVKIPWVPLTKKLMEQGKELVPDAVEFRFKTIPGRLYEPFTLLANLNETGNVPSFGLNVTPASDSRYATIDFHLSGSGAFESASLSIPLFYTGSDGDTSWFNVLLKRGIGQEDAEQSYELYIKNTSDGFLGHQASASLSIPSGSVPDHSWMNFGTAVESSMRSLYIGGSGRDLAAPFYSTSSFEGWLQEIRLWAEPLEETAFDEHVLNPVSYAGNSVTGSFEYLSARFQLGSNLQVFDHYLTGSVPSLHPNYVLPISSGSSLGRMFNTASFVNFPDSINYTPYNERVYANNANTVYASPVTDKIRLVHNTITGSILSPILKLEEVENYYITKDIHILDASFSPQNELNKDIINHFGDTLNLDNIVGIPDSLYTPSYAELVAINADYYRKFKHRYDYRDYVRTIQFFNNSLFRLLKDNVPGRANLLTGVTIKSTMLERNKIQSVSSSVDDYGAFDAAVNDRVDSIEVGNYCSNYGDGSDFYTGELSGSYIDYHHAFITGNINPYALFNFSGSEAFYHSDYNVLRTNAEKGMVSHKYRKLDKHNSAITEEVDLQDGNYSYQRHSNPRYDGSKSTSKEYNVYNEGDSSYGKNAAIDVNVDKFAWIVEVNDKNLNFFDKSSVYIKYLIDGSGSVTELSRQNKNLFEVQNIFKSGTPAGVSLTDLLNPTNQASLDGTKMIWQGGFSFTPIVYREINETMYFQFVNPVIDDTHRPGVLAYAMDSLRWERMGDKNTNTTFTTVGNDITFFTLNGTVQNAPFSFHGDLSTKWIYPTQLPITTGPYYRKNGTTFTDHPSGVEASYCQYYTLDWFLPQTTDELDGFITDDFAGKLTTHDAGGEKWVEFKAPRTSGYTFKFNMPFRMTCVAGEDGWAAFMLHAVLEKKVSGKLGVRKKSQYDR